MYCGDETGAFIGDVGSHSSRFGYGGEDNPKHVVPSYVGYSKHNQPTTCTSCNHDRFDTVQNVYRMASEKEVLDPNAHLQQGDCIENYNAFEDLWQDAFRVLRVRDVLKHTKGGSSVASGGVTSESMQSIQTQPNVGLDIPISHPLLATSPGNTCIVSTNDDSNTPSFQYQASLRRKQLQQVTEILMESLGAPASFVAPTPMLVSFSHGRQTSLVVDMGAGGCRVTPIVDGLPLIHAQRRNGRGGNWLGHVAAHAMQTLLNKPIVPRYQVASKHKSKSRQLHNWAVLDAMYEFRTSHRVACAQWRFDPSVPFCESLVSSLQQTEETTFKDEESLYQLPDGTNIDLTSPIGHDLCRLPELLFCDQVPFATSTDICNQSDTLQDVPLHKLIHSSLTAVGDGDARKELCGNILLSGGHSLYQHLEQRTSWELTSLITSTHKCRVVASRNVSERVNAAWIGGSILTSLGSFQQLWLSREEYLEYGTTLAIQRFPC